MYGTHTLAFQRIFVRMKIISLIFIRFSYVSLIRNSVTGPLTTNIMADIYYMSSVIISFADPKRNVLATGTIPTENLPTQSHEGETKKHSVLVKHTFPDQPSTSTGVTTSTINALLNQLRKSDVVSCWKVLDDTSSGIKMELYDDCHSVPKYTMICDSGLTFTLFTYHWPIPDDHTLYREYNRSVRAENINTFLLQLNFHNCVKDCPTSQIIIIIIKAFI